MILEERTLGGCKVFAGALEAPRGGYTAALIIQRRCGQTQRMNELFRDDSMACNYRFTTAREAMNYALGRAREVVASQAQAA